MRNLFNQSMESKKEAEKFRVGNKVRNLERTVMNLQVVITTIRMVCILLAVLVQEIAFYGSCSNSLGGEWFSEPEQPPIKSVDLEVSADPKLVVTFEVYSIRVDSCSADNDVFPIQDFHINRDISETVGFWSSGCC
jgi:hypothetical protein